LASLNKRVYCLYFIRRLTLQRGVGHFPSSGFQLFTLKPSREPHLSG
jgi:hypothetical protein